MFFLLVVVLGGFSLFADTFNRFAINSLSAGTIAVQNTLGVFFFKTSRDVIQDYIQGPPALPIVFSIIPDISSTLQIVTTKDLVVYNMPELSLYGPIPFRDYTPVVFVKYPTDLVVYKPEAFELAVASSILSQDYTTVCYRTDSLSQEVAIVATTIASSQGAVLAVDSSSITDLVVQQSDALSLSVVTSIYELIDTCFVSQVPEDVIEDLLAVYQAHLDRWFKWYFALWLICAIRLRIEEERKRRATRKREAEESVPSASGVSGKGTGQRRRGSMAQRSRGRRRRL